MWVWGCGGVSVVCVGGGGSSLHFTWGGWRVEGRSPGEVGKRGGGGGQREGLGWRTFREAQISAHFPIGVEHCVCRILESCFFLVGGRRSCLGANPVFPEESQARPHIWYIACALRRITRSILESAAVSKWYSLNLRTIT